MTKQGTATHSSMGSTKQEPISRGVNPGGADALGQKIGRGTSTPLYNSERGLKAPIVSTTHHPKGSQR